MDNDLRPEIREQMREIIATLAERVFKQRLIGNQYRSFFIEAMMEPYLKPYGWQYVGANWGGSDFLHPESNVRLEVKQSAAQQAWRSKPSRGSFDIAPRTGYYRVDTPGRCSQLYVFAWNGSYDPDGETHTTDHRDHAQWEFYVVPTKSLDQHHPEQKKIALSVIKKLAQLVDVAGLGSEIDRLRRRLDG